MGGLNQIFPQIPGNQPSDLSGPIPGQQVDEQLEFEAPALSPPAQPEPGPRQGPPVDESPGLFERAVDVATDLPPFGGMKRAGQFAAGIGRAVSNEMQKEADRLNRSDVRFADHPPGRSVDVTEERRAKNQELQESLEKVQQEASSQQKQVGGELEEPPDVDAMLAELASEDLGDQFSGIEEDVLSFDRFTADPSGTIKEFGKRGIARMFAGFGRTGTEQLRPIVKIFGKENVRVKDGEVFVRSGGSKEFTPLDPAKFEPLFDIFADLSGDVLEGSVDAAVQAGVIKLGAAAGASPIPGGRIAAGAAFAAAPGLGATSGVLARQGALEFMGQADEDFDIKSDILWANGISYSTLGAFKGAGIGGRFILSKAEMLAKAFPKTKALDLAKAMVNFEDKVSSMGLNLDAPTKKAKHNLFQDKKAGIDLIEIAEKKLNETVGAVREEAIELAGGKRFLPQNALSKMREILKKQNVFISPSSGKALMIEPTKGQITNIDEVTGMINITAPGGAVRTVSEAQFNKTFAFGFKGGDKNLSRIVMEYNNLIDLWKGNDGITVDMLLNMLGKYKDLGQLSKEGEKFVAPEIKAEAKLNRAIGGALASDRNEIFEEVFKAADSPFAETWEDSFKKYASEIDEVAALKKLFTNKDTAKTIAINSFKSPRTIRAWKLVLGEDSPEWLTLRNEHMVDMFNQSIEAERGFFSGPSFFQKFRGLQLQKEIADELYSKGEMQLIAGLAKDINDITLAGLTGSKEASDKMAKDMIRVFIADRQLPQTWADVIWRLFSKNVDMTAQMMDSLKAQVRKQPDKANKMRILEFVNRLQFYADNHGIGKIKIPMKEGKEKTVMGYVPRSTAIVGQVGARGAGRDVNQGSLISAGGQPQAPPAQTDQSIGDILEAGL